MYAPLSASIAVANDPRATDVDREVLLAPQKVPGHLIYIFIRIKTHTAGLYIPANIPL